MLPTICLSALSVGTSASKRKVRITTGSTGMAASFGLASEAALHGGRPRCASSLRWPRRRGTLHGMKAWIGATILLAILVLVALLILLQRRFFYFPRKYSANEIEAAEKRGAIVLGY